MYQIEQIREEVEGVESMNLLTFELSSSKRKEVAEMIPNCSEKKRSKIREKHLNIFHSFTLSKLIFSVINLCIKLRAFIETLK
jgi:hypothetical protein